MGRGLTFSRRSVIAQVNNDRAKYGFGPVHDEQAAFEERACDEIARLWVLAGGDVDFWGGEFATICALCDGPISLRAKYLDLCDIVDTWRFDFDLGSADFQRLNLEIQSWIKVHLQACGRKW